MMNSLNKVKLKVHEAVKTTKPPASDSQNYIRGVTGRYKRAYVKFTVCAHKQGAMGARMRRTGLGDMTENRAVVSSVHCTGRQKSIYMI